jgi:hypothetical protein
MGWFQMPGTNKIDEHNEPTEPLPLVDMLPTVPIQQDKTLPAPSPTPADQAAPYQPGQPQQLAPSPQQPYPYVPPPTTQQGPAQENGEKIKSLNPGKQTRSSRRSLKPLLPGFFFIAIQTLLLLRFFLKITGLMADQWWVGVVMGVSEVFVSPFRALWLQVSLQLPAQVEVYTLLAVIVYGLISRLLVRLLKTILKSQ